MGAHLSKVQLTLHRKMKHTCGVWEAQPRALCISEVRNLVLNFNGSCFSKDGQRSCCLAPLAIHYAHGDMLSFRVLCAGSSVVYLILWSAGNSFILTKGLQKFPTKDRRTRYPDKRCTTQPRWIIPVRYPTRLLKYKAWYIPPPILSQ